MTIEITVKNLCAKVVGNPIVVADSSAHEIHFKFDEAWDVYPTKTVHLHNCMTGSHTDVTMKGNKVKIPAAYCTGILEVGVSAGELQATACKDIMIVKAAAGEDSTPETDKSERREETVSSGDYEGLKVNASGHLIATLKNGKKFDCGMVRGERGARGLAGAQGKPGPAGPQGAQGPAGIAGASGKSAYEVYAANGGQLTEAQWLASLAQGAPTFVQGAEDMTDIDQVYVMPDGHIWAYMPAEKTNLADPVSEDWKENYRLNSSGGVSAETGYTTTNFIPVNHRDVLHIKGMDITTKKGTNPHLIVAYDVNKAYLVRTVCDSTIAEWADFGAKDVITTESDGTQIYTVLLTGDSVQRVSESCAYVRICGTLIGTAENVSITVSGQKTDETVRIWQDTGLTYTPADYEDRIVALENVSKSLQYEVDDILSGVISGDNVPDYVKAESTEVAEKILAIRNAKSFVFGAVSDMHTSGSNIGSDTTATGVLHTGMALNTIQALTQLDALLLFGDIMEGKFDDTGAAGFLYVKQCFSDVAKSVPFIQMQGNHDELPADTTEEAQQKYYAYIGANNVGVVTDWNNQYRNYGYRDFDDRKMRVIYLNSVDVSAGEITTDAYITAAQFKWLVDTALDFSAKPDAENWAFIVCCHHPLHWNGITRYLLNILDAYKGKTSGSISWEGQTIAYDFGKAKAEFIAHFHGHLHNFRVDTLGDNGVVSITIPNACFYRNNEYGMTESNPAETRNNFGDLDEDGKQRQFSKTANSANDTAFNVVVIDRQNHKIRCINYGAGIDREISYT